MAQVHLRGKPTKAMYKRQKVDLVRKVKWLKKQLNRTRKALNACQRTFEQIARLDPELAAHCLPHVPHSVIIRGPNDPSGKSDTFSFPMLSSVRDSNRSSEAELDAAA